jgi:DNA adenine methylase
MKTPISYYGGKQKMVTKIVPIIPEHQLYCEPFCGGAAIFFAKPKSDVEVINDTNSELINFYRIVQNDFVSLEKEVRITLHSRRIHSDAKTIYNAPHLFNDIKRAWAVWVMATQSFSAMLDGSFGYDVGKNQTTKKIDNAKKNFTEELAIRLQNVQIGMHRCASYYQ